MMQSGLETHGPRRIPTVKSNVEIYKVICLLYLERAKADSGHADDYVRQAML